MADPRIDKIEASIQKLLDDTKRTSGKVNTLENVTSGLRNSPMIQGYAGQKLILNASLNVLELLNRINAIVAGTLASATAHTNSAVASTNNSLDEVTSDVAALVVSLAALSQQLLNLTSSLSIGAIPKLSAVGKFENSSISDTGSLVTVGGILYTTGRRARSIRITTSPFTLTTAHETLWCNTTSNAITVNLPVGVTGTRYKIINCGNVNNDVTIAPNGTEKLDGVNASKILSDGGVLDIEYEATEGWR